VRGINIVKVAVEKAALSFDTLFSYALPPELADNVHVGQRVIVPFGSGNLTRQGMVLELEEGEASALKTVQRLVDKTPILGEEMVKLVLWLRERTFCTYYDAVRLVIPAGLNMRPVVRYSLGGDMPPGSDAMLGGEQREILEALRKAKGPMTDNNLFHKCGWQGREEPPILTQMVEMGWVRRHREFFRRVRDESVLMAALSDKDIGGAKTTAKQRQVLAILEEFGPVAVKEALYYAGVTRAVVDALYKKGLLDLYEQQVLRDPYAHMDAEESRPGLVTLSEEQRQALEGLTGLAGSGKPEAALLFGITGSGKTQVFLKLMEHTIAGGRQVILLVPEISLTPQAIRIFRQAFGETVAVLHSGLSLGERLDEYKRIKSGAASIAVGTRSAIFSPFDNLGLVIIDEEQEYTYKSESAPRYHARDVAKFRCGYHNALLLMASATPSVETYYFAQNGRYHQFTLRERYGEAQLPQVYVVDMNDEKMDGNMGALSSDLIEAMDDNLKRGEQTILLLNRRGFNTVVSCADCGEVVLCPNCSIAMTYHKANGRLVCHYCNAMAPMPKACPSCDSIRLKFLGLGTQRAVEQMEELFPGARILRMDMDTTMRKFSHEEMLEAFRQGEYDILIGTQMVAKGLDFDNVTLVGVLLADQSLYANDFRSYERAFSLLTQVVGRCGRGDKEGRAYIQTYTPFNDIIGYAAAQDYETFFDSEIGVRKAMLYPPYAAFCVVGFAGKENGETQRASETFLELLREAVKDLPQKLPLRVMGPSAANVVKVAGKYRYKLIIKCVDNAESRALLRQVLSAYHKQPASRKINTFVDMNYHGSL